jgi:single-stranded-DNA-specific exonuclease
MRRASARARAARSMGSIWARRSSPRARTAGCWSAGGGHAMAAGLTVDADKLEALATGSTTGWRGGHRAAMADRRCCSTCRSRRGGLNPALVDGDGKRGAVRHGLARHRASRSGRCGMVKADRVGSDHVRLIVRGEDGASASRPSPFAPADSDLGQSLLHGSRTGARSGWRAARQDRRLGRSRRKRELHIEDAAWAD